MKRGNLFPWNIRGDVPLIHSAKLLSLINMTRFVSRFYEENRFDDSSRNVRQRLSRFPIELIPA